jgi:hypothetical protein
VSAAPAPFATRPALLNAAGAFVLAAIVNSLLHESAHAVAGLTQGLTPTLTPFSVSYDPQPTSAQEVITALAGPVWSLVMGAVLLVVARSWGTGFTRLFWLWLGFMGVMNFVGYLEIAPFVSAGDTGRALTLLHAPGWVFILVALLGAAMQFGLAYLFARQVKRYTSGIEDERVLAFRAWAAGTLVVAVLTVLELLLVQPDVGAVVAVGMYALAVGIFAPMQFIFSRRVPRVQLEDLALARSSRTGLAVAALAATAMIILAAVGGVRLG